MVVLRHGHAPPGTAGGLLCGLLALVCLLPLTGCGESGAAGRSPRAAAAAEPGEAVRGAAAVLARAGTSMTRTALQSASGGTRVTVTGHGSFDYGDRVGRLRVTLPREAPGVPARPPITELFTPGALFMKDRGAGVPPGKWVRLRTASLPDGNLVSGGATDPLTAAHLLSGARRVREVGVGTLGGVAVRRHTGVTDLGAAARATPGAEGEALRAAARGLGARDVPFDAWLDEQGRLRKVRYVFAASGNEVESTTWLYAFGTPVSVRPPAPGDIFTGSLAAAGS